MIKKTARKAVVKLAPGLPDHIARLKNVERLVGAQTKQLQEVKELVKEVKKNQLSHNTQLDELSEALKKAEYYQPLYGLEAVKLKGHKTVARGNSRERFDAMRHALGDDVANIRVLDIGSSLGYMCFSFAAFGARAEGWDFRAENVTVAQMLQDINGANEVTFKIKEFDIPNTQALKPNRYDVVLLLSVLHHTIMYKGLEYTQDLMYELLQKVPTVIVELARKGEDPKLKWDKTMPTDELAVFKKAEKLGITIKKVAQFSAHLSDKKRPMYIVSRNQLPVGNKRFIIDRTWHKAYPGSPVKSPRTYYTGKDVFIKEIPLPSNTTDTNKIQVINELNFFLTHQDKLKHTPILLAHDLSNDYARLVFQRVEGELASELTQPLGSKEFKKAAIDILEALVELEDAQYYHNDIRSWNVMLSKKGARLIDFGLVSPREAENNKIAFLWTLHALLSAKREEPEYGKTALPKRADFEHDAFAVALYDKVAKNKNCTLKELVGR